MPLGISDRQNYGDLSKLRAKQMVNLIIQKHDAIKAKLHYDLRIGTKDTGLFSWAVPKGMPSAGKKHLAIRQPLHDYSYGQFEGTIPENQYGGGTVKKEEEGKLLLTKVEPNKIHFTVAHRKYPSRYVLIRPDAGIGGKEHNWLLMNTTPRSPLVPDYRKEHFKLVPGDKVESVLKNLQPGATVQEKIDGALSLTKILKDKIEVLSYRRSKQEPGGNILHTEKVFSGIPEVKVPKKYIGSVLEGELYGTKNRRALSPQALTPILNSSLAKSLDDQKANKVKLRQMVFDIKQLGNKKVDWNVTPHHERMEHVRNILGSLGEQDGQWTKAIKSTFHVPTEAETSEKALRTYQSIVEGTNPKTREGVIVWPEHGKPQKIKTFNESDVYLRHTFPGRGKYTDKGVGGFIYSHEPTGKIVGEVGSGLDDATRADMFQNPQSYIGRKARVRYTHKLPSGALFQPSFLGLKD
jgi:DNA ligase D-like protein (predicted 3'-phosphoesterase)